MDGMNLSALFRCGMTLISPELNTRICYRVKTGKKLNTANPTSFAEKLVTLKLSNYNHNLLVKRCSDKYTVRDYVSNCIKGSGLPDILNNLLAVYGSVDEIEWDRLPNQFAMKWNFGCGMNIIVHNKLNFDISDTEKKMRKWEKKRYYLEYAEMQYKDVEKKIIIEQYLKGKDGGLPEDYKIYCFSGKPVAILYIQERNTNGKKAGFFDLEWNYLGSSGKSVYKEFEHLPLKPESLDIMIESAALLSKPFPFVRVDFYDVNGRAIFGEMTFTPAGGVQASEINIKGISMGELLDLNYHYREFNGGMELCESQRQIGGGISSQK